MHADVHTTPVVVTLTMNAPRRMTGQTSRPKITTAESAIPAGGQKALALGLKNANWSANRPAATYAVRIAARTMGCLAKG